MKLTLCLFLLALECSFLVYTISIRRDKALMNRAPKGPQADDYDDPTHQDDWGKYKQKFGKNYDKDQTKDKQKFKYWLDAKKEVDNWTGSWKVALNHLSDLSPDEKQALINLNLDHNTNRVPPPTVDGVVPPVSAVEKEEMEAPPASVDWVAAGAVTSVKSQGSCGSCWAFSSIASLESLNIIKNGMSPAVADFSEQQLVNCNPWGSNGCNGGDPNSALIWTYFNGTTTEANYPYTSGSGAYTLPASTCPSLTPLSVYKSFGASMISPVYSVSALQTAAAVRPVVVSVNATNWFSYAGGIFNGCLNTTGNHVVELVGYNSTVWTIKNSWSSAWGANGFIYLNMSNPLCGAMITTYATAPNLAKPTTNVYANCQYFSKSYCTTPSYISYMFANCFVYCGY